MIHLMYSQQQPLDILLHKFLVLPLLTLIVVTQDEEGNLLGVMRVDEVWQPDLAKEAKHVLGTTDVLHPGVAYLLQEAGDTYLAGPLQGAQLPVHYDYQDLRRNPRETRRGKK
jgi:sulfate adenylyltransferase